METTMLRPLTLLVCSILLAACTSPTASPAPTVPADATVTPQALSGAPIVADGALVPAAVTRLAFSTGGPVAEMLVQDGDTVQAGDLLARLGDREGLEAAAARAAQNLLEAEHALDALTEPDPVAQAQAALDLANTQLALEAAERRLANLKGPGIQAYVEAVAQAEAALLTAQENAQLADIGELALALEAAQERLTTATTTLNDAQSAQAQCPACVEVFASGRMLNLEDAQQEYDAASDALQAASIRLSQAQRSAGASVEELEEQLRVAQARLDVAGSPQTSALAQAQAEADLAQAQVEEAGRTLAGPNPDRVAEARARLETARADLDAAQAALTDTELRAAAPGTVVELALRAGEHVSAGQPVVTVADLDRWIVQTTNVTEMEVPALYVGQAVTIKIDALPDLELQGEVEAIALNAETRSGEALYAVEIALAENDVRLRWGMTVEVIFTP